jgi:hypothetical protein
MMAGRGPAPKGERVRGRVALEELPATGELHGPPLPECPDEGGWHPRTVDLWESLRVSPLLADEPELGWVFLVDTARMHHLMWTRGRWDDYASEVRIRLAKFGATPEDRMRLKVKVTKPGGEDGPAPRAGVTDMTSRRDRLSKGA